MLISAETRWFWRDGLPLALHAWFFDIEVHDHRAGGGQSRDDAYMLDVEARELGVKRRVAKPGIEVKVSSALRGATSTRDPSDGRLPEVGCTVEVTRVSTPARAVWTLGFEAFGSIHSVERTLHLVAGYLAVRKLPALTGGQMRSYPAWLSENFRP